MFCGLLNANSRFSLEGFLHIERSFTLSNKQIKLMKISHVLQEKIKYDEIDERDTLKAEENDVTGHDLDQFD